jgi:hypothetical protein
MPGSRDAGCVLWAGRGGAMGETASGHASARADAVPVGCQWCARAARLGWWLRVGWRLPRWHASGARWHASGVRSPGPPHDTGGTSG